MKSLTETLQEVMKHAISGECRPESSFSWHCNDPKHIVHILAKNGFVVVNQFASGDDSEFWDLHEQEDDVPFGTNTDGERPDFTAYSARSANRFDPVEIDHVSLDTVSTPKQEGEVGHIKVIRQTAT